ncbi:acetylcholinesterase [Alligator mississippiensis]|uniref:acetylcholinesterase n=1 Tax=Alligator mississippiensis TaxID=8496 RepID=UPI002877659C|nr:acetylcholinesterase [Alligator mississippiensis]
MLEPLPVLGCLLLLSLLGPGSPSDSDGTMVNTTSGPIRGKRLLDGSSTVTAFLGIPYAKPPVGTLRFQKPLPHQPWTDVLETTSFSNCCHQLIFKTFPGMEVWMPSGPFSEDCLFLNVWVPYPQPSAPVPILIWIHGGGFVGGAASLPAYDGRFLAATENVIVASMNYRLGALGFLSLPPAAPGNTGLWDQQLALRWLRDNAAAFGGDPDRLTLFGSSAGGASVDFHLLSPVSQTLFTRAVMQSGAATAAWAWVAPEEAKQRSRTLGQLLGCPDGDDTALVSCLQGKEAEEIIKNQVSVVRDPALLDFFFLPTADGEFLPDVPQKLLAAGYTQSIPILMGFTANEGSMFLFLNDFPFNLGNASEIGWEELLLVVRKTVPGAPEATVRAIAQRYSQEGQGVEQHRWAMDHVVGDYYFSCPVAEAARWAAEARSPVYAYYFTHHTTVFPLPEWTGVAHASETPFVLGTLAATIGANQRYTEAEGELRRRLMRYWAEFARSGNPMAAEGSEEQWPPFTATQQSFLYISTEQTQVRDVWPARHCSFLSSLLHKSQAPQPDHADTQSQLNKQRQIRDL